MTDDRDDQLVQHPSPRLMEQMVRALRPFRWLNSPVLSGLERIPQERPLLFVGNHTLFGVLDSPFFISELYRLAGITLRPLGDDLHFQVPVWGALSRRMGAVPASPEVCARLMRAGETILVFPGGARETSKRKSEKYKLVWGDRVGFARLAIEHACTIVPFASIGVEDAFDVVVDADEILASPVGRALDWLGVRHDLVMPVVKGLGPTPLPRPERFYFRIAPPIETASYERRSDDPARCGDLRDRTRRAIEQTIDELLTMRDADPDRRLGVRLAHLLGFRRPGGESR
jgi:1-acyl-sn-glycerol-3-phosphate acyltransferase